MEEEDERGRAEAPCFGALDVGLLPTGMTTVTVTETLSGASKSDGRAKGRNPKGGAYWKWKLGEPGSTGGLAP